MWKTTRHILFQPVHSIRFFFFSILGKCPNMLLNLEILGGRSLFFAGGVGGVFYYSYENFPVMSSILALKSTRAGYVTSKLKTLDQITKKMRRPHPSLQGSPDTTTVTKFNAEHSSFLFFQVVISFSYDLKARVMVECI